MNHRQWFQLVTAPQRCQNDRAGIVHLVAPPRNRHTSGEKNRVGIMIAVIRQHQIGRIGFAPGVRMPMIVRRSVTMMMVMPAWRRSLALAGGCPDVQVRAFAVGL